MADCSFEKAKNRVKPKQGKTTKHLPETSLPDSDSNVLLKKSAKDRKQAWYKD